MDIDVCKKIRSLNSKGRFYDAIRLCNAVIKTYPNSWIGYREKADIYCSQGKYQDEIKQRKKLAKLGSKEPADYYDLARLALTLENHKDCIRWADICLSLSKKHKFTYYVQAANFYKAIALKNLGYLEDAIKTCKHLDNGYGTYIKNQGFISKEDFILDCQTARSVG